MVQLYYAHDPMCSWCYGFKPTLDALIRALPEDISIIRLLGGLAPDTQTPMPTALQKTIRSTWQQIEENIPGTKFNYDFWVNCKPRRSTYLSCRSIIAARAQGKQYDELMTSAIQQAYYLDAKNPSDDQVLIQLAVDLDLDVEKFIAALNSDAIKQVLANEVTLCRNMGINSFPGLALTVGTSQWNIPIDYHDHKVMLNLISNIRQPS